MSSRDILILDSETMPDTTYQWSQFNNFTPIERHIKRGYVAMWSAKFLNNKELYTMNEWDDGRDKMIHGIHELMSEAKVIVAHNGDRFDVKKMNTEFARLGLSRPDPFKTVDTLKVSRKSFSLFSHKLDFLCQYFNLGNKLQHDGFDMWVQWMNGDRKAITKMQRYCNNDVQIEQRLYMFLRQGGWITNHPVMIQAGVERPTCPTCKSTRVHKKDNPHMQNGRLYQRWQCKDCSQHLTSRYTDSTKSEMINVLSIAK